MWTAEVKNLPSTQSSSNIIQPKQKKFQNGAEIGNEDFQIERPNPFSVRSVAPGAIPFFFDSAWLSMMRQRDPKKFHDYYTQALISAENVLTMVGGNLLVDLFEENDFKSQLVGSHGTGKSTLMALLANMLRNRGYQIFCCLLRDQQRSIPSDLFNDIRQFVQGENQEERSSFSTSSTSEREKKIIFLDGFEQLSYFNAIAFQRFCRSNDLGLLVSTHSTVRGFPVLFRTISNQALVQRVIKFLLDETTWGMNEEQITALFVEYHGNVRDILFALYDEYEHQRLFDYQGKNSSIRVKPKGS